MRKIEKDNKEGVTERERKWGGGGCQEDTEKKKERSRERKSLREDKRAKEKA